MELTIMAFYNVAFNYKGETACLESYDVQDNGIQACVQRAQQLSDESQREILITITPRVHLMTVSPKQPIAKTASRENKTYPIQEQSACDILTGGD